MSQQFSPFWRSNGDQIAGDPAQWEFRASALWAGAAACHDRHALAAEALASGASVEECGQDLFLGTVATYLGAQALEVLIKAVALQRTPHAHLTGAIYSHDLARIATDLARLQVRPDELVLLQKARHLVEWAGRYPTPRWDAEKGRRSFDVPQTFDENGGEVIDARQFPWSVSWSDLERIIDRVHAIYLDNRTDIADQRSSEN